jgi:glucuronoarabinoxylan endo-1,4-beta-xylanase
MKKPGYYFTASLATLLILFAAAPSLLAQGETPEKLTIQAGETNQTVVGFGAALAYYEFWLYSHPNKSVIYEAIFGELSLDILRVRNAYDYDPTMVGLVKEFMTAAESSLGHPIALLSTSWGPPGYLKNTGDRKNGGTLRYTMDGGSVKFDYAGFAQWWNESLDEYSANGIHPTYISIQNEPDWSAAYETCLFNPQETINSADTIAGYNRALDAVYDTLATRTNRPLILGPDVVGIEYNRVQNYVNQLDLSKLDGISHHLYHGVNENDPYASTEITKVGDFHPEVPHFMTEYSLGDWFSLAGLIYKSFWDEQLAAYIYWDLTWPSEGNALVVLDDPWDYSQWIDPYKGYTKTKKFYAFKQYSAFIHPGWKMTNHSQTGANDATLTFVSPTGDSAVCVIINRSVTENLKVHVNIPGYRIHESAVYSTSETENCEFKGELVDSVITLLPRSISTVDMRIVAYDPADDTEAPSIPTGLIITDSTLSSLTLDWAPSTDNIGVDGYMIYVDGVFYGTTVDTSYVITGLDHSTSCEATISAFDYPQNESEKSAPVTGTTMVPDTEAPMVPLNLVILEIKETSFAVTWDAAMDNVGVTGYHIYLNGTVTGTTSEISYEIEQLTPNTTYEITVSAFDEAGNESGKSEGVVGIIHYFDTSAPILNATKSIYQEGIVVIVSSEEGMVYLVPENTPKDLTSIREALIDSVEVEARRGANLLISGMGNGVYWLYASDSARNISEQETLTIMGVGIELHGISGLEVFPNPISESAMLKFSLKEGQEMWLILMDSQGRMVRKEHLGILPTGDQQIVLHRDDLADGLYFFRLENRNNEGLSGSLMMGD